MASRSRPKSSARRRGRQQPNATKRALQILRKKGLISRSEFRSEKPTKSARKIVKKYKDVIEGRATVVKPSTRLIPRHEKKALKFRRGRVVVPVTQGTVSTKVIRVKEKRRKEKRRKGSAPQYRIEIRRTRRTRGGKLEREIVPLPMQPIDDLPPGKVYRISMKNWGQESNRYFATKKLLNEFLQEYDNIKQWFDISIVDLPDVFDDDE